MRQQPQQAQRDLRRALKLDPDHAMAHMKLGTTCGRRGGDAGARRHFGAAVQVLSNAPEAHQNFATATFSAGRLDAAARHYRIALKLDDRYFNAQLNLGRVLLAQGRRGEARRALQRAAALRPDAQAVRDLSNQVGG